MFKASLATTSIQDKWNSKKYTMEEISFDELDHNHYRRILLNPRYSKGLA